MSATVQPHATPGSKSPATQIDTVIRVETPEKIAFEYQAVGPSLRLFAYLLDLIFVAMGLVGFYFVFLLSMMLLAYLLEPLGLGELVGSLALSSVGLAFVITAIVFWFYGAFLETVRNGQTFGKSVMNIRVISDDGSSIDGVQAVTRNLFRYLDIMPFLPVSIWYVFNLEDATLVFPSFLIGLVCMVVSPNFRRVGDLVAGTMVVLVEKKWVPELTRFSDARVQELANLIPADFVVSRSLSRTLSSFVELSERMQPESLREIASRLATPLKRQFGFPAEVDPVLLLSALYVRTYSDLSEEDGSYLGTKVG